MPVSFRRAAVILDEAIQVVKHWYKCYKEGWGKEIVPEAFSHPAKFARGLIRRIYAHALERGYLKPGDWVADPFAGVGLGAADALANGLNWFGNELEQNFVDMGAGCDCTGISKDDWVRCFGRWKRFAHTDGQHWCPRCLAEAGQVVEPRPPTLPGMGPKPTASYERSSGKIPHTEPHRYAGNLDLFAKHARGGATAVLVQGDSRRLVEVLEGARAEGIIASPPYANRDVAYIKSSKGEAHKRMGVVGHRNQDDGYGTDPAQLGNMPTGEPPSAVISSLPTGKAQSGGTSFWEGLEEKHDRKFSNKVRDGSQGYREDQLGDSEGQLGTMPTGEPPASACRPDRCSADRPQAVIASPPHGIAGVGHDAGHPRLDDEEDARRGTEGCGRRPAYGRTDGQLAAMREGDVDAVIASPPWADNLPSGTLSEEMVADLRAKGHGPARGSTHNATYGSSDGQLAAMREGEPPAGIVSSPPWYGTTPESGDPDYAHKFHGDQSKYAESTTSLYNELTYMSSEWIERRKEEAKQQGNISRLPAEAVDPDYPTFWAAAKTILLQCHAVLAPGGVAIWVVKRFVRGGKIVQFSRQWADLCQSCGFELIEWIKAWLVEERGTQYDLEGEAHTKTVKRFSFFRRLHAQKYPHLAIEWEDVLIFRKPV